MSNLLFSTHDPRLLNVILHRSRYVEHIQLRHLFVDVDSIRETVEDPDFIATDVSSGSVENYYAQGLVKNDPESYLKVSVLFIDEVGRVITAFGVDRPKITEEILWQK